MGVWRSLIFSLLLVSAAADASAQTSSAATSAATAAVSLSEATPAPVSPAIDVASGDVAGSSVAVALSDISGRAREPATHVSGGRRAAQVALFVPHLTFRVVMAPLEGLLWLYDRYELFELYEDFFSSDDREMSLVPQFGLESSFGVSLGGLFSHENVLDHGEKLTFSGLYGGRLNQSYGLTFDTRDRWGEFARAKMGVQWQKGATVNFYGVGNNDLSPTLPPAGTSFDPYGGPAYATAAGRKLLDIDVSHDILLGNGLHWGMAYSYSYETIDFGAAQARNEPVTSVYDATQFLHGQDIHTLYAEASLVADLRSSGSRFVTAAAPSTGARVEVFAGVESVRTNPTTTFLRFGYDARILLNLWGNTRALVMRLYSEAITARAETAPLNSLVRLGGPDLLRGYVRDRFRDRALQLWSVEYRYTFLPRYTGYFFFDAGHVLPRITDFDFSDLRYGGGFGMLVHNGDKAVLRVQVAGSEEGVQFALSFGGGSVSRQRTER